MYRDAEENKKAHDNHDALARAKSIKGLSFDLVHLEVHFEVK